MATTTAVTMPQKPGAVEIVGFGDVRIAGRRFDGRVLVYAQEAAAVLGVPWDVMKAQCQMDPDDSGIYARQVNGEWLVSYDDVNDYTAEYAMQHCQSAYERLEESQGDIRKAALAEVEEALKLLAELPYTNGEYQVSPSRVAVIANQALYTIRGILTDGEAISASLDAEN